MSTKKEPYEFYIDPFLGTDEIMEDYKSHLKERTEHHFGMPYNLNLPTHADALGPFLEFSVNNLGDPFVESNYGVHSRPFEVQVLQYFANLWKIQQEYWGYVTMCGAEGNLYGLLLGRESLSTAAAVAGAGCQPVLYASEESHLSIFKGARFFRIEMVVVKTQGEGEIDYDDFERNLQLHLDRPAIVSLNIGTTLKGCIDNLDLIISILKKNNFVPTAPASYNNDGFLQNNNNNNNSYPTTTTTTTTTDVRIINDADDDLDKKKQKFFIHLDGELLATLLPLVMDTKSGLVSENKGGGGGSGATVNFGMNENGNMSVPPCTVSFEKPIHSIAISGHKFLGCPNPSGVVLTYKSLVKNLEQHIQYLNSVDTTITGSRNGQAALAIWYSLREKGRLVYIEEIRRCLQNAEYLVRKLKELGIKNAHRNYNTVIFNVKDSGLMEDEGNFLRMMTTSNKNTTTTTTTGTNTTGTGIGSSSSGAGDIGQEKKKVLENILLKKWQLLLIDSKNEFIGSVMPNITKEKLDLFLMDLRFCLFGTNGTDTSAGINGVSPSGKPQLREKSSQEFMGALKGTTTFTNDETLKKSKM